MNKTLLAVALLAGFAGVAQAETSVTLYGILDTGYGYSQYKYNHNGANLEANSSGLRSGIVSGNRWGLRGSEDLGDGLRAIFQLEQGFDIGNGEASSTRQFHRQSFVGLASDSWGTFTMGRQYNSGDSYFGATTVGNSFGDTDKTFGSKSVRVDNMFKYETPDFSGFKAVVGYAADGAVLRANGALDSDGDPVKDTDRKNYLTTGLKYSNGPIYVAAIYDRVGASGQKLNAAPGNTDAHYAVTNWAITGSYDFEVVKLALAYGQDRNGKLNGMLGNSFGDALGVKDYNVDGFKAHNYYVGLSAPLGGGTASLSWLRSSSNLDDVYNDGDTYKAQNVYFAKYQYPLSKRTSVYAYGSYGTGVAYLDGYKAKEAGIGLNHRF